MLERGPAQFNIPRDLFYGESDVSIPRPSRVERGPGGPESLAAATEMLAGARFPVILSGGGVVMSDGVAEVVRLAEHLSAPVISTYLHNDSFPKSHPLWAGPIGYQGSKAAMKLLAQADVVLALGTRLGPFGTLPQHGIEYWPKDAKLIQVDANPRKLGLVKQAAVGICGDARAATTDLLTRLETGNRAIAAHATRELRLAEIRSQKAEWEAELDRWGQADGSPISPRRALRELERAMPADAMVSTDIGNICSVSNSYLRFERSPSFFAAMSFGNCGYAYPTAIGAKIASPDRPAIAYVGDGAWGMSLNETLTAVRENVPAVAVVFNNQQWGAEKKNQIDYYADRYLGTNLQNPSFAAIAEAMGARGHQGRSTRPGRRRTEGRHRLRPPDRARAHGHPGAGRPLPPRRAQEAGAAAGEVSGVYRRVERSGCVFSHSRGRRPAIPMFARAEFGTRLRALEYEDVGWY